MEEIVSTFNSNSNNKKTNTIININKNTKKEVLEATPTIVSSKNSKNTVTYRINSNTDLSSISNINIKSINNKNKSNTILNNIDSSNSISNFPSDKKQPFISKSKLIATASTAWNSNQKLYCSSNKKLSTKIYFNDVNSKQQSSGYVNSKKLSYNKDQNENDYHNDYYIPDCKDIEQNENTQDFLTDNSLEESFSSNKHSNDHIKKNIISNIKEEDYEDYENDIEEDNQDNQDNLINNKRVLNILDNDNRSNTIVNEDSENSDNTIEVEDNNIALFIRKTETGNFKVVDNEVTLDYIRNSAINNTTYNSHNYCNYSNNYSNNNINSNSNSNLLNIDYQAKHGNINNVNNSKISNSRINKTNANNQTSVLDSTVSYDFHNNTSMLLKLRDQLMDVDNSKIDKKSLDKSKDKDLSISKSRSAARINNHSNKDNIDNSNNLIFHNNDNDGNDVINKKDYYGTVDNSNYNNYLSNFDGYDNNNTMKSKSFNNKLTKNKVKVSNITNLTNEPNIVDTKKINNINNINNTTNINNINDISLIKSKYQEDLNNNNNNSIKTTNKNNSNSKLKNSNVNINQNPNKNLFLTLTYNKTKTLKKTKTSRSNSNNNISKTNNNNINNNNGDQFTFQQSSLIDNNISNNQINISKKVSLSNLTNLTKLELQDFYTSNSKNTFNLENFSRQSQLLANISSYSESTSELFLKNAITKLFANNNNNDTRDYKRNLTFEINPQFSNNNTDYDFYTNCKIFNSDYANKQVEIELNKKLNKNVMFKIRSSCGNTNTSSNKKSIDRTETTEHYNNKDNNSNSNASNNICLVNTSTILKKTLSKVSKPSNNNLLKNLTYLTNSNNADELTNTNNINNNTNNQIINLKYNSANQNLEIENSDNNNNNDNNNNDSTKYLDLFLISFDHIVDSFYIQLRKEYLSDIGFHIFKISEKVKLSNSSFIPFIYMNVDILELKNKITTKFNTVNYFKNTSKNNIWNFIEDNDNDNDEVLSGNNNLSNNIDSGYSYVLMIGDFLVAAKVEEEFVRIEEDYVNSVFSFEEDSNVYLENKEVNNEVDKTSDCNNEVNIRKLENSNANSNVNYNVNSNNLHYHNQSFSFNNSNKLIATPELYSNTPNSIYNNTLNNVSNVNINNKLDTNKTTNDDSTGIKGNKLKSIIKNKKDYVNKSFQEKKRLENILETISSCNESSDEKNIDNESSIKNIRKKIIKERYSKLTIVILDLIQYEKISKTRANKNKEKDMVIKKTKSDNKRSSSNITNKDKRNTSSITNTPVSNTTINHDKDYKGINKISTKTTKTTTTNNTQNTRNTNIPTNLTNNTNTLYNYLEPKKTIDDNDEDNKENINKGICLTAPNKYKSGLLFNKTHSINKSNDLYFSPLLNDNNEGYLNYVKEADNNVIITHLSINNANNTGKMKNTNMNTKKETLHSHISEKTEKNEYSNSIVKKFVFDSLDYKKIVMGSSSLCDVVLNRENFLNQVNSRNEKSSSRDNKDNLNNNNNNNNNKEQHNLFKDIYNNFNDINPTFSQNNDKAEKLETNQTEERNKLDSFHCYFTYNEKNNQWSLIDGDCFTNTPSTSGIWKRLNIDEKIFFEDNFTKNSSTNKHSIIKSMSNSSINNIFLNSISNNLNNNNNNLNYNNNSSPFKTVTLKILGYDFVMEFDYSKLLY